MIKYQLKCHRSHEFEGWFRNSDDFDIQAKNGHLTCPICGSEDIGKAIMAPAIARHRGKARQAPPSERPDSREGQTPMSNPNSTPNTPSVTSSQRVSESEKGLPQLLSDNKRLREIREEVKAAVERARDYVEKNFDYVGDKFPEEARKIHYGETDERGIYGKASIDDVQDLIEEGIEVAPLPGSRSSEAKNNPTTDKPATRKQVH